MGEQTATARRCGVRLVGLVVMCLIAGFVVQTGVAFGIAAFGPTADSMFNGDTIESFAALRDDPGWGYAVDLQRRGSRAICIEPVEPWESRMTIPGPGIPSWAVHPPANFSSTYTTRAFGWPLLTWRGLEITPYWIPTSLNPNSQITHMGSPPRHPLPTIPIPLNTLANSAFYGVIIAGVWLIASTARRMWRGRFKPGSCTHCGYALAGLPSTGHCPECGRER